MNLARLITAFTLFATTTVVFGQGVPFQPPTTYGPPSVNLSPFYHRGSTYEGDALRGAGAFQHGLGTRAWGEGQYFHGLGNYLNLRESARSQAIQNGQTLYEQRKRVATEHTQKYTDAVLARRADNYRASIVKHRDRPEIKNIISGESLNFLLEELGDYASSAEISAETRLMPHTSAAVVLQTSGGISVRRWNELISVSGYPIWPSDYCFHNLLPLQQRIEEGLSLGVQYAKAGQCLSKDQANSMRCDLSRLRAKLAERERATTNRFDLDDVRFFSDLDNIIRGLGNGEAVSVVNGILTPATGSPQELVAHMIHHRLRFGPADVKTLPLYRSIHQSLAKLHRDRMDLFNVAANR